MLHKVNFVKFLSRSALTLLMLCTVAAELNLRFTPNFDFSSVIFPKNNQDDDYQRNYYNYGPKFDLPSAVFPQNNDYDRNYYNTDKQPVGSNYPPNQHQPNLQYNYYPYQGYPYYQPEPRYVFDILPFLPATTRTPKPWYNNKKVYVAPTAKPFTTTIKTPASIQPEITNKKFTETQKISYGLEQFAHNLFLELEEKNHDDNIIISPLSIEIALAMLLMGTKGKTYHEIRNALQLSSQSRLKVANHFHNLLSQSENNTILKTANKIYTNNNYEVREDFKKVLARKFFSSADPIDFSNSYAAAEAINTWVANKTDHAIKNLVQPSSISEDTCLVLVNAIQFQCSWAKSFIVTEKNLFYLDNTNTVDTDMMYIISEFRYGEFPKLDAQALELPFKDDYSMIVLLPNKPTGLNVLKRNLKTYTLADITKNMQLDEVSVNFPKFKVEFEVELTEYLQNLNMRRMFSGNAELGNIFEHQEKDTYISNVFHKATIDVNENGTSAAAATEMEASSRMMPRYRFDANKPFIYLITYKNKVVVFSGSFKKPQ